MHRLIERGCPRALVAALVLLVASRPSTLLAAARNPAPLMAGAAAVEVALPHGVPLGGYGGFPRRAWVPDIFGRHPYAFWFRPSAGIHDAFKVRSLALESGSVRVLWLAVDLVGIDPGLLGELRERLGRRGLSYAAIIASASHTHSGPGAYAESSLFGFVAIDRLSTAVRRQLLDGFELATQEAESRKVTVRVATARTEVRGIAESRVQQPLDSELGVVTLTGPGRRVVALLWNYAIHGTALGRENLLLSGDLMGEANARLEREIGAPALFVNGAVGDVSPRPRGWAGVKAAGEALAGGALRAVAEARTESDRLELARERVVLPAPTLALKNCVRGWAPGWMTVGLSETLPSSSELIALALGRTAWVTIPGELQTSLGLEIKASGRDRFSHVFIAGVSNDYLGYFLAPREYRRPSYIACASLYGERGGPIMRDAALAALHRLSSSPTSSGARPAPIRKAPRRAPRPAIHPERDRELKRARTGDRDENGMSRAERVCWNGPPPSCAPEAGRGSSMTGSGGRSLQGSAGAFSRSRSVDGGVQVSSAEAVELVGERRLLPSGGVPVQHAAAHCLIERADGVVDGGSRVGRLCIQRRPRALDGRANGAARGPIPLTPLLALLHSLDR